MDSPLVIGNTNDLVDGKGKHMETLIERLRKRAAIRRSIDSRKSVQEGKPDKIADLLEEAANHIEKLEKKNEEIPTKETPQAG